MTETVAKDIIVKGSRAKPNPELADAPSGGDFFAPFVPRFLAHEDWQTGIGGRETPVRVRMVSDENNVTFIFEDIGIKARFLRSEWDAMPAHQQRVFTWVFQHYDKSDRLEAALRHYAREEVSEIVFRYGTEGTRVDGTKYEFAPAEGGRMTGAQIDSRWEEGDDTKTDLKPGFPIVISFNSAHPAANIGEALAKMIIHELLHPWVPDLLQPSGRHDDHDRLYGPNGNDGWVDEEFDEMFGAAPPERIGAGGDIGIGYLGSRYSDNDVGSAGSDMMAGMEGNDVLNGMGGSDLLAGGLGMDTLIAGSGFSDLRGGLDADTYVASQVDASFFVDDAGGVDRLMIAGSSAGLRVARYGDSLSITSTDQGYTYVVVDHFLEGKRVEIFRFSDAEYSASYLEYLAQTDGTGGGVCYDDGHPVICGPYGMPVVIDLGGDGIELVDANKSRVRWDVDGDGKAERVGWTAGSDAFLVLDRNGNGVIDSFSELSFLSDFRGAGSDLEGLLAYDDNGDGFLTEADRVFSQLQLWQDANGDGVSQSHELLSLAEGGVTSIGLEIRGLQKLDQSSATNQVLGWSGVTLSDGRLVKAHDVGLYFKSRDDEYRMPVMKDGQYSSEPVEILLPEPVV